MNEKKIIALIIDDEANGRENLGMLLRAYHPRIEVIDTAANLLTAERLILEKEPQLIFLDIHLGPETAFTLLNRLKSITFEIIFVTAHEDYALRAFEFMAIDYLLKPIDIKKLEKAVISAIARIDNKTMHLSMEEMMLHVRQFNRHQHKIALSTQTGYEMVYIRDIMYCQSEGSYTRFLFTDGEELLVSKNLKYYENLLSEYAFSRSHNTTLVNLLYVKRLERSAGGYLVMENNKTLPVSKSKRQELEAQIKENRRLV